MAQEFRKVERLGPPDLLPTHLLQKSLDDEARTIRADWERAIENNQIPAIPKGANVDLAHETLKKYFLKGRSPTSEESTRLDTLTLYILEHGLQAGFGWYGFNYIKDILLGAGFYGKFNNIKYLFSYDEKERKIFLTTKAQLKKFKYTEGSTAGKTHILNNEFFFVRSVFEISLSPETGKPQFSTIEHIHNLPYLEFYQPYKEIIIQLSKTPAVDAQQKKSMRFQIVRILDYLAKTGASIDPEFKKALHAINFLALLDSGEINLESGLRLKFDNVVLHHVLSRPEKFRGQLMALGTKPNDPHHVLEKLNNVPKPNWFQRLPIINRFFKKEIALSDTADRLITDIHSLKREKIAEIAEDEIRSTEMEKISPVTPAPKLLKPEDSPRPARATSPARIAAELTRTQPLTRKLLTPEDMAAKKSTRSGSLPITFPSVDLQGVSPALPPKAQKLLQELLTRTAPVTRKEIQEENWHPTKSPLPPRAAAQ